SDLPASRSRLRRVCARCSSVAVIPLSWTTMRGTGQGSVTRPMARTASAPSRTTRMLRVDQRAIVFSLCDEVILTPDYAKITEECLIREGTQVTLDADQAEGPTAP